MAPEILEKKGYNHKVDIWAIGVIMFVIMYNDFPFKTLGDIKDLCKDGFDL